MKSEKKDVQDGEKVEKAVAKKPIAKKTKEEPVAPEIKKEEEKAIDVKDVINALFRAYGENGTDEAKRNCPKIISQYLKAKLSKNPIYDKYNVLILFDENSLVKGDSDKIYNAVTKFTESKPILLILYSRGGSAASAYLIGKLCREYAKNEFHVAVPRFAKSAATMICCAANNIHMGSLSELGPIDPQINGLPALGLKNSVEHIAELVKLHQESSSMFAEYLNKSLPLIQIGYYERVAESAQQYAEKLLLTHKENLKRSEKDIAQELVYKYKDHGFVIDRAEAAQIFGDEIIKSNTDEYEFSNMVYTELTMISSISNWFKRSPYYIGSLDTDISFLDMNKKE
ncbi:SDH family Clp fold serine proteinase [Phaeodactylibacter xiamenensis]|uniref:SDH family Clp fold serine proteinase n=1 Tax=Phaeodactylibacter xiamenensis TaxID=1524460 RepID=UPI003BACA40C